MAGGKGERLKPLTLETPKPLIKILGKPILQYNIELLANQGISKIILSTGYLHEKIENFFKNGEDFGVEITYSVENQPLGTGGALKNCKEKLDERFVMLNGDYIANYDFKKTNKFHEKSNAGATLQLVEVEDITGFGVAKLNKGKIIEFMEKPTKENAPSKLINAGAYIIEKWAVHIGGGVNYRFGLYDWIMIKDNHIDHAGGIKIAITRTHEYLKKHNLNLNITIETRNLKEVQEVLEIGGIHQIMFDNMDYDTMREAVKMVNKRYITEASGNITLENARKKAETGVDFISMGMLTHSVKSMDISLKAFE
ncbi:MAG: sugar phosphate nucleotidyltransferase [Candidatus Diapherotrites archaeon]